MDKLWSKMRWAVSGAGSMDMVVGFDGPVIDGYIKVPEAPGLGVELNEDEAREYAQEGEPFFEE